MLKAQRKRKSHNFAMFTGLHWELLLGYPQPRFCVWDCIGLKYPARAPRFLYGIISNYSSKVDADEKARFFLWSDFFPSWRRLNQRTRQGAQILDLQLSCTGQGDRAPCRERLPVTRSQMLFSPSLNFHTELGGGALLFLVVVFALAVPCLESSPPGSHSFILRLCGFSPKCPLLWASTSLFLPYLTANVDTWYYWCTCSFIFCLCP